MAEVTEVEPIVVAGRVFRPTMKTTFEQDFFVIDLMSNTSVNKLSAAKGDDLDKVAEEIILNAYRSGNLFRLLAGLVVEEGKKWSVKTAEQNAIFFAELNESEDKEAIREALLGVLLSFFVNAEAFSKTSAKSSISISLEAAPEQPRLREVPTGSEVLGMSASEVLRATTQMSSIESPDGQSEKDFSPISN